MLLSNSDEPYLWAPFLNCIFVDSLPCACLLSSAGFLQHLLVQLWSINTEPETILNTLSQQGSRSISPTVCKNWEHSARRLERTLMSSAHTGSQGGSLEAVFDMAFVSSPLRIYTTSLSGPWPELETGKCLTLLCTRYQHAMSPFHLCHCRAWTLPELSTHSHQRNALWQWQRDCSSFLSSLVAFCVDRDEWTRAAPGEDPKGSSCSYLKFNNF